MSEVEDEEASMKVRPKFIGQGSLHEAVIGAGLSCMVAGVWVAYGHGQAMILLGSLIVLGAWGAR